MLVNLQNIYAWFQGEPGTVIQATVFEMRTQSALFSEASDSMLLSLNGNWTDIQKSVSV